ncbi:MAG: hypothetical protein RR365_14780 [Bacteroides sp.]
MKKVIITAIIAATVLALCVTAFFAGSRYTILNQRLEIVSETQATVSIFGNTDVYCCK